MIERLPRARAASMNIESCSVTCVWLTKSARVCGRASDRDPRRTSARASCTRTSASTARAPDQRRLLCSRRAEEVVDRPPLPRPGAAGLLRCGSGAAGLGRAPALRSSRPCATSDQVLRTVAVDADGPRYGLRRVAEFRRPSQAGGGVGIAATAITTSSSQRHDPLAQLDDDPLPRSVCRSPGTTWKHFASPLAITATDRDKHPQRGGDRHLRTDAADRDQLAEESRSSSEAAKPSRRRASPRTRSTQPCRKASRPVAGTTFSVSAETTGGRQRRPRRSPHDRSGAPSPLLDRGDHPASASITAR